MPYRKLELMILGGLAGMGFTDGLHIWVTNNYRFYYQGVFIFLLIVNTVIAWIQYEAKRHTVN